MPIEASFCVNNLVRDVSEKKEKKEKENSTKFTFVITFNVSMGKEIICIFVGFSLSHDYECKVGYNES